MSLLSSRNGGAVARRGPAAPGMELLDRTLLAHDLRGGLNGILGGLAALDPETMPRDMREQVERVFAATESLACLMELIFVDLPDGFDARGSREREVDYGCVDVPRILDYLRRRWTAEAREKGLSLRVVAEADAPTLLSVALLPMARMLGNLMGNAVKHCVRGGIEVVASATREGGIVFRLSDTGPGVREEVLEAIRLDPAPEALDPARPAPGLGLRVVRLLAEEIGAGLALRNREGGGFEALVTIAAEQCARPDPAPPKTGPDLAGVRILLAEDNPTNQMVATQMLRALRAEVTVTSDGAEALAAYEIGSFDMVVLDIEMPRVSGLDVIRRIRARGDARAGVPIVALTAYALREHQERIARAGANGLISKPISGIEALGRALAAHLPAGFRARRDEEAEPSAREDGAPAPVLDAAIYEALAQAIGPELMGELLEKVVADLDAARTDIEAARAPGDRRAIRAASHILISVAGAVGAVGLQSLARELNGLANGEAPLGEAVAACLAEIDAVQAFLARDM